MGGLKFKNNSLPGTSQRGNSVLLLYGTSDSYFVGSRLFNRRIIYFIKGHLSRSFIILLSLTNVDFIYYH